MHTHVCVHVHGHEQNMSPTGLMGLEVEGAAAFLT